MTLKTALLNAQDLPEPEHVLLGTAGGFVLRGDIEGPIDEDSQVISFRVASGMAGVVERANGSPIAIPSGHLLIPIRSIAWISQGNRRSDGPAIRALPSD
jgi:hypothetical protein